MESQHLKIYKNRLFVASLIEDVLSEKISVLDALSKFPKDKNDINIKCAFDALMHREADEDLRRKIRDYAITQDEFLEDLAYILKENQKLPYCQCEKYACQKLPKNIVDEYLKYHNEDLVGENLTFIKSVLKNFKRMINF